MSDLKDLPIIYSYNPATEATELVQPLNVYIYNADLKEYFGGYKAVHFVSSDLYKRFKKTDLDAFLLAVGCKDTPRRIKTEYDKREGDLYQLRANYGYEWNYYVSHLVDDYNLEGLDNFLKKMTKDRSLLLWKILTSYSYDYFKSTYSCKGRSGYVRSHSFVTKFIVKLNSISWLYDKNNNLKKPMEIALSDLSDDYMSENYDSGTLVDILNFQLDEIKAIEEKTGGKFIPEDEVKLYEQWKAETLGKTVEEDEDSWSPDVAPNDIPVNVESIEPAAIQIAVPIEPLDSVEDTPKDTIGETESEDIKNDKPISLKKIGRWGEEYVFKYLKERYETYGSFEETLSGFRSTKNNSPTVTIIWPNKKTDVQKGYDFLIKENEVAIEYIEVKTKTSEEKELIRITGTQWEFARELFNNNHGDKYKLYVVENAGSKNAKIKKLENPIKLWKDGKLYAHPINFKL